MFYKKYQKILFKIIYLQTFLKVFYIQLLVHEQSIFD